jgi:pimeloyl-ACP methyl ester carboxylesterase
MMRAIPVALVAAAALLVPAPSLASSGIDCEEVTAQVPIDEGGPSDHLIAGTLCRRSGSTPDTVQLLVHGGTYNRSYWDWPTHSPYYSYVRAAAAVGYATLSIDNVGSGASSHPPSTELDVQSGVTGIHGVVSQLRSGALGGRAFEHVVWVGHSFGSIHAWNYAARFDDVDAFVLTGALHAIKPSWVTQVLTAFVPAGGGLDPGYLTTAPGTRDDLFYYSPTAEPGVVAKDEATKDTLPITLVGEIGASPPPAEAPSRSIHVPTLLVVGRRDGLFCGPPDGLDCTDAGVLAAEGPYYSPAADLDVETIALTGHVLSLHLTAPLTHTKILGWVLPRVPPD